jgi:hypothetical protein
VQPNSQLALPVCLCDGLSVSIANSIVRTTGFSSSCTDVNDAGGQCRRSASSTATSEERGAESSSNSSAKCETVAVASVLTVAVLIEILRSDV